jgi:aryl-alcohol dehydrogenase-like predicted oxidoreductase
LLPYCKFNGIGVIPWGPLGGGSLARPPNAPDTVRSEMMKNASWANKTEDAELKIISRVQELAQKKNKTIAQISLAWASSKISSPIVGLAKVERIDDAIGANSVTLTEEEIKYLEEP